MQEVSPFGIPGRAALQLAQWPHGLRVFARVPEKWQGGRWLPLDSALTWFVFACPVQASVTLTHPASLMEQVWSGRGGSADALSLDCRSFKHCWSHAQCSERFSSLGAEGRAACSTMAREAP